MIQPIRVLCDKVAGRTYYIDSMNQAYADRRFTQRVKCGLGHKMWSSGEFLICDSCQKRFNGGRVKCEVIPNE